VGSLVFGGVPIAINKTRLLIVTDIRLESNYTLVGCYFFFGGGVLYPKTRQLPTLPERSTCCSKSSGSRIIWGLSEMKVPQNGWFIMDNPSTNG
jgi:hypothetical protein